MRVIQYESSCIMIQESSCTYKSCDIYHEHVQCLAFTKSRQTYATHPLVLRPSRRARSVLAYSITPYSSLDTFTSPYHSLKMSSGSVRSIVVLATALTLLVNEVVAFPVPPPSLGSHSGDPSHALGNRQVFDFSARRRAKHYVSPKSVNHHSTVSSLSSSNYGRLSRRAANKDPISTLQPSYNRTISSSEKLSTLSKIFDDDVILIYSRCKCSCGVEEC